MAVPTSDPAAARAPAPLPAPAPSRGATEGLPPGPSAPALAQTVAFARDPLGALRRARATHGPLFTLRFTPAGPFFVVADPAAAATLVDGDPHLAHAGEARRRVLPMASPRSSFGADGARHREARARIAPALGAEATAQRREDLAALAARHVAAWPRGRPVRLLQRMRLLADEAIAGLVAGVRDPDRARALAAGVRRIIATPGNPPTPPPGEGDGPLGTAVQRLFDRRRAPVAAILAQEIDERRAGARPATHGAPTLLDLLAASDLPAAELADEVLVVLLAAQEPMAIALTRVLERAAHEPQVAAHLASAPAGDPWSAAIVDEALRLTPAALASLRRLTAPLRLGGHDLPAGTDTLVPIPLLHRDPRVWEEPDAFRPARFAGHREPAPPLFLPFGGGARRCAGEPLARAQLAIVVPEILRAVRLHPLARTPERMVQRGTVLVPAHGALAVARAA
jgi:cytochrome P450